MLSRVGPASNPLPIEEPRCSSHRQEKQARFVPRHEIVEGLPFASQLGDSKSEQRWKVTDRPVFGAGNSRTTSNTLG